MLGLILIWLFTVALLHSTREQGCRLFTSATAQSRGRFVRISSYTGLDWYVGGDGVLSLRRGGYSINASFSVEWQHGGFFCLRSLEDLRLVEVVSPPGSNAHTLRTGRYGCTTPQQHFSFRASSIFSHGVNSFINVRDKRWVGRRQQGG